jgi:hypothetical protein
LSHKLFKNICPVTPTTYSLRPLAAHQLHVTPVNVSKAARPTAPAATKFFFLARERCKMRWN